MNTPTFSDRIFGGLWGVLVGDALGVPVEFRDRYSLRADPVVGMRGYGTHRQPAGTWSDDSSMLLCTAESLLVSNGFNAADMASRFVRWEQENHWTPHGEVFDIGIATSKAISRLANGLPPEQAGGTGESDNGNGSLMRILPVALWFNSSADVIESAQRSSSLTHRHPRSQMACAFYCLVVRELLAGAAPGEAISAARGTFARTYEHTSFASECLRFADIETGPLASLPENEIESSGYVMHTLKASLWSLLTSHSFQETVLKAVNLGGDSDTTGAVAGGLAGVHYGVQSIPLEWRKALAREADVEVLFNEFLTKANVIRETSA